MKKPIDSNKQFTNFKNKKTKTICVIIITILLIGGVVMFRQIYPYFGWETAHLKNEKISLRYPKGWDVEYKNENAGTDCSYDFVDFRNAKHGKTTLSIQFAQVGTFVNDKNVVDAEQVIILGEERSIILSEYMDDDYKSNPKSENNVAFATVTERTPNDSGEYGVPVAKNTTCNGINNLMTAEMMYIPVENEGQSDIDVKTFKNDPNYEINKKILESMKYEQ